MPRWAESGCKLVSAGTWCLQGGHHLPVQQGEKGLIPSIPAGWFPLQQSGEDGSALPHPLAALSTPERLC